VLGIARNTFETDKDVFEAGKVAAANGGAAKRFKERAEKGAGLRRLFFCQHREGELTELLGKLIGPERLKQERQLPETGGNRAASRRFDVLEAAGVIHEDGAGFTAGCFRTRLDKLGERLANHGDGHAPDIGAPKDKGFLAWC
jgi:hypothetical protein